MEMIRQQIPHDVVESQLHSNETVLTLPAINPMDDVSWEKIARRLRGKTRSRALKGVETRRFIEVVLWVTDNELCWNHVPARYGKWHTVYVRFGRWALACTWDQLATVMDDQDSAARLQRRVASYLASRRARKIPKGSASVEDMQL
jgi:transposase